MESVRFTFLVISVAAFGLHAIAAHKYKRDEPHFEADRLGEPPEEDPSPGAVESDIMLTDEQKVALEESDNEKTNPRSKRQGKPEHFDANRLGEPPEEDPSPGAVESDIMLTDEQKAALEENQGKGKSTLTKRKAIANAFQRWPHKTVLYKIDASAQQYSKTIKTAIKEWKKYTCLKFKPANEDTFRKVGHRNYVNFVGVPEGCSSYVGYVDQPEGAQEIKLANKCAKGPGAVGVVIHEIGHAIGFFHEQSRPDRDDHVTIHYENIKVERDKEFKKQSTQLITTNDIPYDHASVMHYGSHYFSKNGKATIEPRNLEDRLDMGRQRGLTRYDIKHANTFYECKEENECETLNPCKNGGSCVDEPGTYHCECPEGFRGLNCDVECVDNFELCNVYTGRGECVSGPKHRQVMLDCEKSCGLCAPYVCEDTSTTCPEEYCNANSINFEWAKENCQETCGFCNYCNSNPCLNGGTCQQVGTGTRCICAAGFSGENCQNPF